MHKAAACLAFCFAATVATACEESPSRLPVGIDASHDARIDAYQPPTDGGMNDLGQDGSMAGFDAAMTDADMADAGFDATVMDSGFDSGQDAGFDAGPPFPPGQCNPGYPDSYAPGCDCFCYTSTIEAADCQDGSALRCQTQSNADAGVLKNYCYADQGTGSLANYCGWSLATPLSFDYLACESEFLSRTWSVYSSGVATGETCTTAHERLNGQNYYSLRCNGNPSVSNQDLGWMPNFQCGVSNGSGCIANGANADLYTADGGTLTRDGYKYTITFNVSCTQATVRALNPVTQSQLWFRIIK